MLTANNTDLKNQALLLQPPAGDLTGPYPALCYLKSFAAGHHHPVRVKDLGIEAFDFLSQPARVEILTQQAAGLRRRLEKKRSLNFGEQKHYLQLVKAVGIGLDANLPRKAAGWLKSRECFYSYRSYKRACRILDAFFNLLSVVHFPTVLTGSDYPTATMLNSMTSIMAHCTANLNPYIDFYLENLFPQIESDKPPVIGISMVFASQSVQALVLGKLIKERFPEIHVTLGGAYLSQWVMVMEEKQLKDLFRCTDSVICGEGELPFVALLERIKDGKPFNNLPNLIYRDDRGRFRRFEELVYTDVATQPPPDFSDLDMASYLTPKIVIPYSISRGCYWGKCVFCQNRYGDFRMRRYQTVPVDKAICEMKELSSRYHSNHFNFSNDVIDPAYLKKFSQTVIESKQSFVWNTDLRAEKKFTRELCLTMAKAGLNAVAIGFESGCQKTLDAMGKGNRVETTRTVLKNLYDAGVATQVMGIFGFPGETETDGEETLRFLEENTDRISYYVIGLLMVLPGSRIYNNPTGYGVTAVSYAQNALKTPEPVWHSNNRISIHAVHRLYERLGRMENVYTIDEYPYVGGLSTNHGFLYFQMGPDILKRLRDEQNKHHNELQCLIGEVKPVVPDFKP